MNCKTEPVEAFITDASLKASWLLSSAGLEPTQLSVIANPHHIQQKLREWMQRIGPEVRSIESGHIMLKYSNEEGIEEYQVYLNIGTIDSTGYAHVIGQPYPNDESEVPE